MGKLVIHTRGTQKHHTAINLDCYYFMNKFFCLLLEKFCPLFKHFAHLGYLLPKL